jgi:AcrR family transcriptional regulator
MPRKNSRLAIINAALKLFAAKGFDSATVDEVAAEAKIAKGTIFYNFKSKEDIFHAIVDRNMQEFGDLVRTRSSISGTSFDRIEAAYDAATEYFQTNSSFGTLFISELGRVRSKWNYDSNSLLSVFRQRLQEIYEEGQNNREFRTDVDAKDIGVIIFFLAAFNCLVQRLTADRTQESRLAEKAKMIFLKGIRAD